MSTSELAKCLLAYEKSVSETLRVRLHRGKASRANYANPPTAEVPAVGLQPLTLHALPGT